MVWLNTFGAILPSTRAMSILAHTAGVLELRLVAKGLALGMRCTSVSLRNKWTALVGKLLRRISSSIHFILHKWSSGPGSAGPLGTAEQAEKARDIACETLVMLLSAVLYGKDPRGVPQGGPLGHCSSCISTSAHQPLFCQAYAT